MLTQAQLVYLHSAIQRTYGNLSQLSGAILQLQNGDAMGNPLPATVKDSLETQGIAKFQKIAQAFAAMSQAIIALKAGDHTLIDQIIPPV